LRLLPIGALDDFILPARLGEFFKLLAALA